MALPKEYGKASETIVLGNLRKTFRKDNIMIFKLNREITEDGNKYITLLVDRSSSDEMYLSNILQNVKCILDENRLGTPSCSCTTFHKLPFAMRQVLRVRWANFSTGNAFSSKSFE